MPRTVPRMFSIFADPLDSNPSHTPMQSSSCGINERFFNGQLETFGWVVSARSQIFLDMCNMYELQCVDLAGFISFKTDLLVVP